MKGNMSRTKRRRDVDENHEVKHFLGASKRPLVIDADACHAAWEAAAERLARKDAKDATQR